MSAVITERKIDIALLRSGGNLSVKIKIPDSLQIIDTPNEKPPEGFGTFRIMTPKDGDKRVVWDKCDFAQIVEAKAMFDECVVQGLVPYLVGLNGRATAEVMTEFDPHAEEILFLPIQVICGG